MLPSQEASAGIERIAPGGRALLRLTFTTMLILLLGSVRLVLLALTPVLTFCLVATAFAGLAVVLLFGSLLHTPNFHALPILAISAVSLGLVMLLYKALDLLRPR